MAIIERRLKYIRFDWDDDTQELTIETYGKFLPTGVSKIEVQNITGSITLNKTYIFSTMIFMRRIIQRMTRGFPAWVKKRKK